MGRKYGFLSYLSLLVTQDTGSSRPKFNYFLK